GQKNCGSKALDLQRPVELTRDARPEPVRLENRERDEARSRDDDERGHESRAGSPPAPEVDYRERKQNARPELRRQAQPQPRCAGKPPPRSGPLSTGRSWMSATNPASARSVGQRSKRVPNTEPSTTGETANRSSAAHVRAGPASTFRSVFAMSATQPTPHSP